jgi:hypothetical protein
MEEIYWITRLGIMHDLVEVLMVLFLIACLFSGIVLLLIGFDNEELTGVRRIFKVSIIPTILLVISYIAIPSKEDALAIYGIGGTIDYIKSNSEIKQLPNKIIKALDVWSQNYNNQNIDKNE